MQVLSCVAHDELQIGNDISVTILEVHDDHVLVGISSPQSPPAYWEQKVYTGGNADFAETAEPVLSEAR